MRRPLVAVLAAALVACVPPRAPGPIDPGGPTGGAVADAGAVAGPPASTDPRVGYLRIMTDLLAELADQIEVITGDAPPSNARCDHLAAVVVTWGDAHHQAYESADADGSLLGLTAADAADPAIRVLARELALVSTQLVDLVDEDCLYGSGSYGDALYEYLIAYQGLAHWSSDDQAAAWDYQTLIDEAAGP